MHRLVAAIAGAAVAAATLGGGEARAAEVAASSAEALRAALAQAGPGTEILLGPGDYGALAVSGLAGAPGAPVVLRSADPANPARFARLDLKDAAHIELRGLLFDYDYAPGDETRVRPFQIAGGRDVAVTGTTFDGDRAADGYPTGFGLSVRRVDGFALEASTIRGFYRGLAVGQSSDVTVRMNDVHDMRMDGMTFAQVSRVLIEGNHIHDFDRWLESGDHSDMIQFWTNRTSAPSTDVTIRGNLLNSGGGWYTQSIFMRNEEVDTGRAGREMFYRNLRIENNVILNAHLHGITVGEADGLLIANNSVLRNADSEGRHVDDPTRWTPRIRVAEGSTDVRIQRNVASEVAGFAGQGGWVVADNLLVQDRHPSGPGYYGQVFMGFPGGDPGEPASFAPRPGGPLDGTGLGALALARQGG